MQADRLRKPQTYIKGDRERGVPPQLSTAEENKKMAWKSTKRQMLTWREAIANKFNCPSEYYSTKNS